MGVKKDQPPANKLRGLKEPQVLITSNLGLLLEHADVSPYFDPLLQENLMESSTIFTNLTFGLCLFCNFRSIFIRKKAFYCYSKLLAGQM